MMIDHPAIDELTRKFWMHVAIGAPDECWEYRAMHPYASVGVRDAKAASGWSRTTAHRLSYEIHYGPISDGLQVLHRCDNGRCVNPAHLHEGDQRRNLRDCVARGRFNAYERQRVDLCKYGHQFTPENTCSSPGRPWRICRTCKLARTREWRRRRRLGLA